MSVYDYYITPDEYEIARKNGIGKRTLEDRIRQWGWDKERAMTEKVTDLSEWVELAKSNGITKNAFYNRRHRGMSNYEAATKPMLTHEEKTKIANKRRKKYPKHILEKAERNGICYKTFVFRVTRTGMSYEEAATTPLRK